ncbi:hypothetical protein V6N13_090655 [Hibiscus sabdariffa]
MGRNWICCLSTRHLRSHCPNPFANEGDEVASVAYRYRRWKLDNYMHLVARCEVQNVVDVNNQTYFLTLNALNEFDPKCTGVDWRQKLETQRDHFNHVILGVVVGYKPRDLAAQIIQNTANMWGINDYVEEPLPEEEQVQPPTEEANVTTNDVEDKEIEAQT